MQTLLFTVVTILSLLTTPTTSIKETKKQKNICLIPASYPWIFGPYQSQMYALSLHLNSTNEYENIYWLPRVHMLKLKKRGIYETWEDVRKGLLPKKTSPPPDGMELDHLKFLGSVNIGDIDGSSSMVSASMLSILAEEYDIDVFVLLVDSVNYIPDTEYVSAAVVAWKPLHTERVHPGMTDFWAVRNYHAVAALAPFAKESLQNVITTGNAIGGVPTFIDYVPHFIDRNQLEEWASEGQAEVQLLMPSHIDSSTFFVLLQGGNYDELDRKGWNEAIQAYGIFRNSLAANSNVHLYLHAFESYLVEQDSNNGDKAPANVLPSGVKLTYKLALSDLKVQQDYTLDMTQHHPTEVAALKKRASLCLHPSKAEGFGLNSVECQALGKPVITTNYTAMKDFTKLGAALNPDQFTLFSHQDLATPPVKKIVSALHHYYQQHLDILQGNIDNAVKKQRQDDIQETKDWVDTEFSVDSVSSRMDRTIQKAISIHSQREKYQLEQERRTSPPQYETDPVFQIIRGETMHINFDIQIMKPWVLLLPDDTILKNLHLDYQGIQNFAWGMVNKENSNVNVLCIPTFDQNKNKLVPVINRATGGPHTNVPILLKAHWFYKIHTLSHRRISIVWFALKNTQEVMQLPEGLSTIMREDSSMFVEL